MQEHIINEFMELKQGDMTVQEYTNKFEELPRFTLSLIANERVRASKFLRGLKPNICGRIVPFRETTNVAILRCAQLIEGEWMEN